MKVGRNLMSRRTHFEIDISRRPQFREIHGVPAIALGKGMFSIGLAFICGLLPVLLWREEIIFSIPALACFLIGLFYMKLSLKRLLETGSTDEDVKQEPEEIRAGSSHPTD